jgi:predicted dehydrogenase
MTQQALEKGEHVIVEKPFTTTTSEAEELITIAKKNGLILAVFQNRRFDIDFKTVQKVLKDGTLGNIKLFESKMYKWRPDLGAKIWKIEPNPASGLFYDLGPHLIDQALVLFGKPKSIFTDLAIYRKDCIVDDYFETIFYYDDKKVILKGFYLSAINEPRFTIYGDMASYQKLGHDIQEPVLISGILPDSPEWSEIYKNQEGKIYRNDDIINVQPEQTDYRNYFDNVYNVIRKGAELIVKPEEAMEVIRLIELGIRSYEEKKVLPV